MPHQTMLTAEALSRKCSTSQWTIAYQLVLRLPVILKIEIDCWAQISGHRVLLSATHQ